MISATPEQTEFNGQIYKIALDHVTGNADFEPAWKKFLVEFQELTTQSYAQKTSGLNVKLTFLQMLLKHFPSLSVLKTDPRVASPSYGNEDYVHRCSQCQTLSLNQRI